MLTKLPFDLVSILNISFFAEKMIYWKMILKFGRHQTLQKFNFDVERKK